jgi:hypothetical protein
MKGKPGRSIQIPTRHFQYLRDANYLPPPLAQIIESEESAHGETVVLVLSEDVAEDFRSTFTERLAKAGFGADYELTCEGRMLEELIDRFA